MIERHGIIPTIEHLVTRRSETQGYHAVVEMGMPEMAFEAVVLRHPEHFSEEPVSMSRERLSTIEIEGTPTIEERLATIRGET